MNNAAVMLGDIEAVEAQTANPATPSEAIHYTKAQTADHAAPSVAIVTIEAEADDHAVPEDQRRNGRSTPATSQADVHVRRMSFKLHRQSLVNMLTTRSRSDVDADLRPALEAFLDGSELDFSSHVRRAATIVQKLVWAQAKDARVKPSAAEVYASIDRSLDVFERCYQAKDVRPRPFKRHRFIAREPPSTHLPLYACPGVGQELSPPCLPLSRSLATGASK